LDGQKGKQVSFEVGFPQGTYQRTARLPSLRLVLSLSSFSKYQEKASFCSHIQA